MRLCFPATVNIIAATGHRMLLPIDANPDGKLILNAISVRVQIFLVNESRHFWFSCAKVEIVMPF